VILYKRVSIYCLYNANQVAWWCSGQDVGRSWVRIPVVTLSVIFWGRWPSLVGKLSWHVTTIQVNSALHPFGVAKSSTGFCWGKGGKVTSAKWQVVISRSGDVSSYAPFIFFFLLISVKSVLGEHQTQWFSHAHSSYKWTESEPTEA